MNGREADMADLGKLKRIDLREVWADEAGEFTPWLAQEENIKLLGDAIGIELEVEAQEKPVGPFSADILCKDTVNNLWVLIENQLERTDHTHLGQLMTYAAGLDAVTIIWIAEKFTDEHRAAMDWLNEITDESINFFGLEVELWQIGESPIAPKFNIVSKPNEWSKTIKKTVTQSLTETKKLQLEYWTEFHNALVERTGIVKPHSPRPQQWMNFALGSSKVHLRATINTQKGWIRASIICKGGSGTAKVYFSLLKKDKEAIQSEFAGPLNWEELPNRKECRISIRHDVDPTKRQDWPNQHLWLAEKLETLYKIFSPRVKKIDPTEYAEESSNGADD